MTKTILLASAAVALALTSTANASAVQKAAVGVRGSAHPVLHVPPKGSTTLYDQNIGDGAYGFFSQTLSSYPQYNEYLADDFVVPAGHTWKISEVDATGFYYIEYGPATDVNVLFWKDNGNSLPHHKNGPKVECDHITPKSGLDTGVFQIKLPNSCKVHLGGGGKSGRTYWVTVQANMAGPFTSGYWAWQSNANVANSEAAGWWYGGSVTTNDPKCNVRFKGFTDCTGISADFAFALQGTDSGG